MQRYQVLTTEKPDDVSLEEAQTALAASYPEYKVEVFDGGHQFIAKLERIAADDEGDEEEEAPAPAKKKVPPFLEEKDDAKDEDADDADDDGDDDDADDEKAPAPKKKDKGGDKDGDDLGFQDPDAGEGDVVKALKAVKTLEKVLPALKNQLKSLNGGDDLSGPGDLPGGPGGPGGDVHGLVPPPPPDKVGPTPGAPPAAAGGKGPFAPSPAPNVNHGLDQRKSPPVGVPTFGSVQDKFVMRPVRNPDGSAVSLAEAASELGSHPRYASYYVHEIKFDADNDQWVAHLKSR